MTISFTSRTENQVTKLQQDADKSLVAAEAGIEAAIKNQSSGSFSELSLDALKDSGIDVDSSKVTIDAAQTRKFVSPAINKDEQYTLYLTPYNGSFPNTPPFNTHVAVYYGDGGSFNCGSVALELTVVSFDSSVPNPSYTVERYVADTGTPKILGTDGAQIGNDISKFGGKDILTTHFNCVTTLNSITLSATAKLMFIRVIGVGATTKIGIDDGLLPVQGKYYTATAKSTSGVTKTVQLFQSYPQIPAEFFVTSF
jgi:hypothetical protein